MNARIRNTLVCGVLACIAGALPLAASAQTAPAPASSAGMDMSAMPGMAPQPAKAAKAAAHAGHAKPTAPATQTKTAPTDSAGMDEGMGDMDMSGMDHGPSHGMHAMPPMRMQGGAAPPDARSPDYSDGMGYGHMAGMDRQDVAPQGMLLFDQLEAFDGLHGNGQSWEMEGWYGTDLDKLWLRSEGEHAGGRFDDSDVEALWSHAVAAYWDTQLGVRNDFGGGPSRQWFAFGVEGLAPYWFEVQATAYAGPSGRTAARLQVDYELLFTQRLILQPELEVNLYGKADPQRRIGSGLSDASFGLRLRYEFHRQFAPYVGVVWTQRYGGTADFARDERQPAFDRQLVAGLRIWF